MFCSREHKADSLCDVLLFPDLLSGKEAYLPMVSFHATFPSLPVHFVGCMILARN